MLKNLVRMRGKVLSFWTLLFVRKRLFFEGILSIILTFHNKRNIPIVLLTLTPHPFQYFSVDYVECCLPWPSQKLGWCRAHSCKLRNSASIFKVREFNSIKHYFSYIIIFFLLKKKDIVNFLLLQTCPTNVYFRQSRNIL